MKDKKLEKLRELVDTAIACIHTNEDLMVQAACKHLWEMKEIIKEMEAEAGYLMAYRRLKEFIKEMEAEIDAGKKGEEK